MDKLDLKKTHKRLYAPSADAVDFVTVPKLPFLMLDGSGDPNNSPLFPDALGTINGVAYALKFAMKKQGVDFAVMPTEGLWWVENLSELDFDDKSNWLWTLMILMPDSVTRAAFDQAIDDVRRKKNPPLLDSVQFETYGEGLSAQIMHIGSYEAEQPTIARLHEAIKQQGYDLRGKHHEIYLSDPRRTAPDKLKTILRQPVIESA